MYNITRKVCTNKGNPRVWIERQALEKFGLKYGDRYTKFLTNSHIILKFNPEGKSKIVGTKDRPIIDLNGKFLKPFLDGASHYKATFIFANETQASNQDSILIAREG